MTENPLLAAPTDRIAIERWEGEGGRALPLASAVEPIENVVLGGGEAGKYIAWELAKQGRSVMVIERALVGGSCPNVACLPSKNVIRSAKVADLVRHADGTREALRLRHTCSSDHIGWFRAGSALNAALGGR